MKGMLLNLRNFIRLYSNKYGEINNFLKSFYLTTEKILDKITDDTLELQINFENPVEMSDMMGTFIENKDDYKINMWLCIDEDVLINVTNNNADDIIRYLYERFPY